jgi:hypothetical protein
MATCSAETKSSSHSEAPRLRGRHRLGVEQGGEGEERGRSSFQANGTCERFIGSLKWECLDYMLILHGCQLQHLVREYVEYYNQARPHQGIEQQIPDWHERGYPFATTGPVIATPVLNGLHHDYS